MDPARELAQLDRLELGRALAAIGNRIGRDAKQPGRERRAAPFEAREILERAMENIGGEILRLIAIVNPPRDERIHAFEIVFVKLGEAGRDRAARPRSGVRSGASLGRAFNAGSPATFASNYINRRDAKRLRAALAAHSAPLR